MVNNVRRLTWLCFCIMLFWGGIAWCNTPNFLRISPSARASAMGQTVGLVAGVSPTAVIMNPAAAGLYAQQHVLGAEFIPMGTDWLGDNGSGITYSSFAVNTGISVDQDGPIPITLGFTFHQVDMHGDNIKQYESDGPTPLCLCQAYGQSTGVGLALALDMKSVQLSTGVNIKSVTVELPYNPDQSTSVTALDVGFILQATAIHGNLPFLDEDKEPIFGYNISPGLSLSWNNMGDEIGGTHRYPGSPLPRMVSTGIHIKSKIMHHRSDQSYPLLAINWAQEAGDLLNSYGVDGARTYQNGLGDINFIKHVLMGKTAENSINQKGLEITIANVFSLRYGHYQDPTDRARWRTRGWGLNVSQAIRHAAYLLHYDHRLLRSFKHVHLSIEHARFHTDYRHHIWTPQYYQPLPGTQMTSVVFQIDQVDFFDFF